MNGLAFAAAIISAFAVLGAGYFTFTTNKRQGKLTELDMQWGWAMERIKFLEADNLDLKKQNRNAEERMNMMQAAHTKCEERLQSSEVNNALLQRLLDERSRPA